MVLSVFSIRFHRSWSDITPFKVKYHFLTHNAKAFLILPNIWCHQKTSQQLWTKHGLRANMSPGWSGYTLDGPSFHCSFMVPQGLGTALGAHISEEMLLCDNLAWLEPGDDVCLHGPQIVFIVWDFGSLSSSSWVRKWVSERERDWVSEREREKEEKRERGGGGA